MKNNLVKTLVISILLGTFLTGCSYSDLTGKSKVNDNNDSSVKDGTNNSNQQNKNTKAIDVSIGQSIEYDDNYIISFIDYLFTQRINPSNPDSYYSYYEAQDKSSNTLFVLKTTIKNLGGETLDGDSLPGATLIYDGKYKYELQKITEKDDGSDLEGYRWYMDIDPLKTKKIWYKVEVPLDLENNTDKSLEVEYNINNKTYRLKVR